MTSDTLRRLRLDIIGRQVQFRQPGSSVWHTAEVTGIDGNDDLAHWRDLRTGEWFQHIASGTIGMAIRNKKYIAIARSGDGGSLGVLHDFVNMTSGPYVIRIKPEDRARVLQEVMDGALGR